MTHARYKHLVELALRTVLMSAAFRGFRMSSAPLRVVVAEPGSG